MTGFLEDLDHGCDPQLAQTALLGHIAQFSGVSYRAQWKQDEPDHWQAELTSESGEAANH